MAISEAEEEEVVTKPLPAITKVYLGTSIDGPDTTNDPFTKAADTIKGLSNVSSNRKRKITAMEKSLTLEQNTNKEAMQKSFTGSNGAASKKIENEVITGYNAFEVVSPPYNLDWLSKLYEISVPHAAAVEAKVANIVGLGYEWIPSPKMNRKADDLDGKQAELDKFRKKLSRSKDILDEWLDDLNTEDTFQETLTKVWRDYETTGNAYIEIGRDSTGSVAYFGHIPSATMRVRRERDGFVQIISNKAVFFRNFGETEPNPVTNDPTPNEVIHLKKSVPSHSFYGVPNVISAKNAVAGIEFSDQFNLDYFENKAVPRHVVILQGATINPNLAKNILEFFETGLKGKNHRTLFIPLPGGDKDNKVDLRIEPVEAGVQDSSFNNYRKGARDSVLMAHRVPISKIGLAEGVSLAVARDADKTFKEQVCQPEQKILEKKLNRVFKTFTDMFLMKLNEMSLTDENTQSQIDERRRKTGTETANEQRIKRGLPALPKGDELVDLNAAAKKLASDAKATGNRERDAQRSAAATDSAGEGRNSQGAGRTIDNGGNQ